MYNERKDKLSLLNYLVYGFILLIIVVIIIIIIVKSVSKKSNEQPIVMVLYSEEQLEKIEADYNEELAANMASFKYNVIDYYQYKLGTEKVEMTFSLQDLYDKHFIEKLTVNNVECDSTKSKVDVTKKTDEYKLDFVLSCENEVQLTTYLGKYSYCEDSDICEKKVEQKETIEEESKVSTPDENPEEPENKEESSTEQGNLTESMKYTYYEYVLSPTDSIGTYSDWSDWSESAITADLMTEVDKKTETETKTENCTETKEETYISGYNTETYITGYTTKKYVVGTKKVQTGTKQVTINGKVVNEPVYTEQPIYQTKEVPVYGTKKTPIYSTRQVTVDNCTVNVDYYRYRTFTYNKGLNYVIYSTNENDSALLNNGYVKTGNTKEI